MNAVISLFVLLFIFKTIGDVDCGCNLSMSDFKTPSPVFLSSNQYLAPGAGGVISVPRSGIIVVACPGQKRNIVLNNSTTSYDVMEAHCIANKTFRVDRWIGSFDQITCNGYPFFESQQTSRTCFKGGKIYEIGYKIKNKFHQLYELCFDRASLSTHYVKHELLPSSIYMQRSSRPHFIEGDMFDKVKMSDIYKVENQRSRLDAILGVNMSQNYITMKKQYLTRGHLAARADYTLLAEQRATFHYANSAPQWIRGNAGDWAALEDALRRRINRLQRSVTVYTGTHDVISLPDNRGVYQPIYLYTDANNNGVVPVPLYFYKLVYDSKTKTATAFVSINASVFNSTRIKELTFCDDLCTESEFSWLKWRPNDGTHSFCCDYIDFTRKIGTIEDLDIHGPFY